MANKGTRVCLVGIKGMSAKDLSKVIAHANAELHERHLASYRTGALRGTAREAPMRLAIKGSPKNAKREAARQGIPVKNCFKHPKFNETFCDAPESARGRVVSWYGKRETRGGKAGRGVAPGALLFFNGAGAKRKRRRQ